MSEFLTVKDLVVEYSSGGQHVQAVNGVSFTLGKGETGAGKTTIAKAILQILPAPLRRCWAARSCWRARMF